MGVGGEDTEGRPGLPGNRQNRKSWKSAPPPMKSCTELWPRVKHGFAQQQATTRVTSVCLACDYHNFLQRGRCTRRWFAHYELGRHDGCLVNLGLGAL